MNFHPSFRDAHSFTADEFSRLRLRALYDSLLTRFFGKRSALKLFTHELHFDNINRKYLGIKQIHVHQVVGTLNRQPDFDAKFRPLGKHLRQRWINAYLSLERDGWSPILVHKIGSEYFVEDGHHRVSIARLKGMYFIDAIVWEYSKEGEKAKDCHPKPCTEQNGINAYASRSVNKWA